MGFLNNIFGFGQSSTHNLINDSILRTRRRTWEQYQRESEVRIAVLEDDYEDIFKAAIKAKLDPDAWKLVYNERYAWWPFINVAKNAIQNIATLYNRPPVRMFLIGEESEFQPYVDLIEKIEVRLNRIMAEALRLSLMLGGVVIRLAKHPKNPERWIFQIMTPDQFVPIPDPDEPNILQGLEYSYTNYDNQKQVQTYHVSFNSDPENPVEVVQLNGREIQRYEGPNYRFINPDGKPFLPFVYARVENRSNQIVNRTVGMDLYYSTISANWLWVQKEWLMRHQSHKQPVVIGDGALEIGKQILDPTIPMLFNADAQSAKIDWVDVSSDPKVFDDAIDKIIEWIATARGFSLSEFKVTSQVQSAEAIELQNRSKIEYMKSLETDFREVEEEIAQKLLWIEGIRIPQEAVFEIEYFDPFTTKEDENEQREETEEETEEFTIGFDTAEGDSDTGRMGQRTFQNPE